MKTFKDILFKPHPSGNGVIGVIKFHNGYGASVIKCDISYGGKSGLYELAVLKNGDAISDDNSGWLSEEDVTKLLVQIQQL
jgi:hypothetical protein